MIASSYDNIQISGIATAVPFRKMDSESYSSRFGDKTVKRIVKVTGVKSVHQAIDKQTAGDLSYEAANKLMQEKRFAPSEIGVLIFIATCGDYIAPSTASVIAKRLHISQDCMVFDINLGCSGFLFGMNMMSSLLNTTNASKGLLLTAETNSKIVSQNDSSIMLFGDAGAATLVERVDTCIKSHYGVKSDGDRYDSICIPAGGFRKRFASREMIVQDDGVCRTDYDLHMDGGEVFNFALTDVVDLFKEFVNIFSLEYGFYDAIVLHQASIFIINRLISELKLPREKVPIILERFGNTSAASIPLTLCESYGDDKGSHEVRVLLSAFGIGLSWAMGDMMIDVAHIYPTFYTDSYYQEAMM